MYTWPAINRSMHVAAVASSGGGKTTAYLLPLVKQLEGGSYADLPESCGVSRGIVQYAIAVIVHKIKVLEIIL